MSEAQVGTIHDLLAECIACAGVFDVSIDYEADKADLENATQAVLDHVQTLRDERDRLRRAVQEAMELIHEDIVKGDKAGRRLKAEAILDRALREAALTPAGGQDEHK